MSRKFDFVTCYWSIKYAQTLATVGLAFFQHHKPNFIKGFGELCGKHDWVIAVYKDRFAIHNKVNDHPFKHNPIESL
jgi:hypothetical protein